MTDAAKEHKQLDSVTDYVQEQEVDTGKMAQAMDALASAGAGAASAAGTSVKLSKADVQMIVDELEVSRQTAERVLRKHEGRLEAALHELVHSTVVV
mmetsp:Transcript_18608/g.59242  ORF Transcript_18608/g.59242 Transcript_18608/m.59242 type:complete len:97 (+) Transcript_18608:82-372(+)|eukprot:CAMPEP_0196779256 /NCGR_PEP_ID=MMETSP1104-20130614/6276_1 /TAXON_ID=33652 /ORGANISM="Cafeteria sp., Strain Caron Lab Isolate" /LENGTH=96 /DNA_ID=CAMNT_0042149433 /DNA_START=50 /DNA_END=340 /DNA_ORIENTATION=+